MSVGEFLRRRREARGLTQVELSFASGIQPGTISKIERGDTDAPSIHVMHKLAEALGLTLDEIYSGRWQKKADSAQPTVTFGADLPNGLDKTEFVPVPVIHDLGDLASRPDTRGLKEWCVMPRQFLEECGEDCAQCVAVRITDESMAPCLRPGDLAFLDTGCTDISDAVNHFCVCRARGDIVIRTLRKTPEGHNYYLEAINKEWEREHGPTIVRDTTLQVFGVVKQVLRSYVTPIE